MTSPRCSSRSAAYQHIHDLLAADRCVTLDGGIATELQRLSAPKGSSGLDRELWGTWALYRAPQAVLEVHHRYIETGCDVISTNTWSILSAPEAEQRLGGPTPERRHWMDIAQLGIHLPRRAIADAGRQADCAVAFAISEDETLGLNYAATANAGRSTITASKLIQASATARPPVPSPGRSSTLTREVSATRSGLIAHLVIVVRLKPDLLNVEGLCPIHVRDRDRHQG